MLSHTTLWADSADVKLMIFSRKNKKNISKCCTLKVLPSLQSVYYWYPIYPRYSDSSTPYQTCSKIWTSTIYYLMLYLKIAGWVANSGDPDEMQHSAASHLGLLCLLVPFCLNMYGKYAILDFCISHFARAISRSGNFIIGAIGSDKWLR